MTFPTKKDPGKPPYKGAITKSHYVPMRDGTRLAVDVSLPRQLASGDKIPALFAATRYWRALNIRFPFSWFLKIPDSARDFFTAYGFAVLRIDMRGTGASEGNQSSPWPTSDLNDLYDLTDWVIAQKWSNGKVSAFGNSYQATTAEMLGATGHPAVTSALVRFNEYDVYTDIAFPGGVPNEFMLREWAEYNQALDNNQNPKGMSFLEKLIVSGVKPVEKSIPNHRNHQVDSALENITFRDEVDPAMGVSIDEISIHTRPTTHFLDHWGGWFDAATADAVIRRFANNPHPQRAVIGPWNHGATQFVDQNQTKNPFPLLDQMKEALGYLRAGDSRRILNYYTLNENIWKETEEWPPAGIQNERYFLCSGGILSQEKPSTQGSEKFIVDFLATSGKNNRWQTELDQRPVIYKALTPNSPNADGLVNLVSFQFGPLNDDMEITGYPIVTLFIKSTESDGSFFVYIEAVDGQGKTQYLTEGMLRGIHRKVSNDASSYKQFVPYHSYKRIDSLPIVPGEWAEITFGLNPISVLIRRGWLLKVSISGSDIDTFKRIPEQRTPNIEISMGGELASCLDLPVNRFSH